MPRIEILPHGWEESRERARGDGSPTIDVCKSCGLDFAEDDEISAASPVSTYTSGRIGVTDVAHPPYEGEDYPCNACGALLTEEDD